MATPEFLTPSKPHPSFIDDASGHPVHGMDKIGPSNSPPDPLFSGHPARSASRCSCQTPLHWDMPWSSITRQSPLSDLHLPWVTQCSPKSKPRMTWSPAPPFNPTRRAQPWPPQNFWPPPNLTKISGMMPLATQCMEWTRLGQTTAPDPLCSGPRQTSDPHCRALSPL